MTSRSAERAPTRRGPTRPALRCAAAALLAGTMAAPAAAAEPLTLTDQSGRTVTLDGPAERIATIPIPAASMLVAVDGGTDRLAAMHPLSKTALLEGVLGEFFPEARDIPSEIVGQGFMPNVEELLAVSPDLVFQWAHQGDDIVEPLINAGLPVATFHYGTEDLTRGWLEIMAAATGEPERAGRFIDWRERTLGEIEAATAGLAEEDRPRVLYFLRYLSDLRIAGSGTYNDYYIGLAGGINPAAGEEGWRTVNPEQVIAWDPEVILLNGFEEDLSPQDVYDNPLYAGLTAVQERRVYKVPLGGYRWDPPNQESPLMWLWLTELLHPERMDRPLRREIADAYECIYGTRPSEAQIDAILRLPMNGDAAHYGVFAAAAGQ